MRRVHARFVLICLTILAAAVVAGAQSRTRTVITSGEPAPGGGVFAPTLERMSAKGVPTISGRTIVLGSDLLLNGQSVYGVYAETNGVQRVVTRVGSPAPGGGTIQDISHFTTDQFGNVFLVVRVGNGATPDAVLKYSFPVLSSLARVGDALPNGETIATIGLAVAADGQGGAYFQAAYGATAGATALVHAKGDFMNTKELVAATGQPAPGGGTFGAVSPSTIASSTSGLVAFTATVDGGPSGIFSGRAGNLLRAADAVDALPNLTIADNDDAEVSFTEPATPGIKTATLTGTTTFVANGTPAPRSTGTINFGGFQIAMAADREGSLYFFAPIAGDGTHGAGLFRRDRFTNQVTSVVLQGDPAASDVGGVYGFFALASSLPARIANDDGKVVFGATAGSNAATVAVFTTLGAPDGLVPSVAGAAVKGSKLTVTGGSFEAGARILVNGTPLADTKNNKKSPSSKLTSKSGASAVAPGATVSISVMNPTGAISSPISYTRPR
jgi:hypothetical protein